MHTKEVKNQMIYTRIKLRKLKMIILEA